MNLQPEPIAPWAAAQAFFADQGLPFPPLPPALSADLQPAKPHLFATCAVEHSAFDVELWIGAVDANAAPRALLGVDGRGFNSWAMHYFLVDGPLALFVQCPWGGAFGDAGRDAERVKAAFAACGPLQEAAARALHEGRAPIGRRLLVVHGAILDERCAWLTDKAAGEGARLAPQGHASSLELAIEVFDSLPPAR